MSRKDDDLLRLAFGELSSEKARAVEARAGADESRADQSASASSTPGLQHLPPPPPDGLNAERLRAAILDRELRVRQKPFAWPVLFAPAALAALAAVVLLPRLRVPVEPRLAVNDSRVEASTFEVAPLPPLEEAKEPIVSPSLAIAQAKVAKAIEPRTPRLSVASRRRTRRTRTPVEKSEPPRELVALNHPSADEIAPMALVRKPAPETLATPPSAVVESAYGVESGAEAVVVVSTERDLATGVRPPRRRRRRPVFWWGVSLITQNPAVDALLERLRTVDRLPWGRSASHRRGGPGGHRSGAVPRPCGCGAGRYRPGKGRRLASQPPRPRERSPHRPRDPSPALRRPGEHGSRRSAVADHDPLPGAKICVVLANGGVLGTFVGGPRIFIDGRKPAIPASELRFENPPQFVGGALVIDLRTANSSARWVRPSPATPPRFPCARSKR